MLSGTSPGSFVIISIPSSPASAHLQPTSCSKLFGRCAHNQTHLKSQRLQDPFSPCQCETAQGKFSVVTPLLEEEKKLSHFHEIIFFLLNSASMKWSRNTPRGILSTRITLFYFMCILQLFIGWWSDVFCLDHSTVGQVPSSPQRWTSYYV